VGVQHTPPLGWWLSGAILPPARGATTRASHQSSLTSSIFPRLVASASLYFVPRNVMEPIFRIPFATTLRMESVDHAEMDTAGAHDEVLRVASTERIDMRMGNRNMPYVSHRVRPSLPIAVESVVVPDSHSTGRPRIRRQPTIWVSQALLQRGLGTLGELWGLLRIR
jgi:hypothetical protein